MSHVSYFIFLLMQNEDLRLLDLCIITANGRSYEQWRISELYHYPPRRNADAG
jgi:hypothetical protein